MLQNYPCPSYGCPYVAKDEYSLRKHFKWLCKFHESTCPLCLHVFKDNVFQHYNNSNAHPIIELHEEANIASFRLGDVAKTVNKNTFFSAFGIVFRIHYKISACCLFMCVVSNLESNDTDKFDVCLTISPKERSTQNELFSLKLENVSQFPSAVNQKIYDWKMNISFVDTFFKFANISEYNLIMHIKKI